MGELSNNISAERKKELMLLMNDILYKENPEFIAKEIVKAKIEEAKTIEEKQFIDFYFNLFLVFNMSPEKAIATLRLYKEIENGRTF